jgi:hypothetical protein
LLSSAWRKFRPPNHRRAARSSVSGPAARSLARAAKSASPTRRRNHEPHNKPRRTQHKSQRRANSQHRKPGRPQQGGECGEIRNLRWRSVIRSDSLIRSIWTLRLRDQCGAPWARALALEAIISRHAQLFADARVSGVDGGSFFTRDFHEFGRRAALRHAVGVVFGGRAPPSMADLLHGSARQQAQDGVGVASVWAEIGRFDAPEFHSLKPKWLATSAR